jgi:hypothetical protein
MKKTLLMLLMTAFWMGLQAAGTVEKTYMLKDFSGLKVSGDIQVHYTQGNTYEVRITTDERKLDRLVVEVRGENLVVGYKPKSNFRGDMESTHLYLTCPKMERIENSGACSFTTEGFKADRLEIDASGATTLQLGTVHCQTVDVDNSGATKIYGTLVAQQVEMGNSGATRGEVKVEADYFGLKNSGATTMTFGFKGKRVDIKSSGAGNVNLEVDCQELRAGNSGVASLVITGIADEVKIYGSGVSRINTKGLNKY